MATIRDFQGFSASQARALTKNYLCQINIADLFLQIEEAAKSGKTDIRIPEDTWEHSWGPILLDLGYQWYSWVDPNTTVKQEVFIVSWEG